MYMRCEHCKGELIKAVNKKGFECYVCPKSELVQIALTNKDLFLLVKVGGKK